MKCKRNRDAEKLFLENKDRRELTENYYSVKILILNFLVSRR